MKNYEILIKLTKWSLIIKILSGSSSSDTADNVVIVGHATPTADHAAFFDPRVEYMEVELENSITFLYLNGDAHAWSVHSVFFEQPNFVQLQVEGGTRDPPLAVSVA